MDARKLKSLLAILQKYNVTHYEDKELKLDLQQPEAAPTLLDVSSEIKDLGEKEMRELESWSVER